MKSKGEQNQQSYGNDSCFLQYVQDGRSFSSKLKKSVETKGVKQHKSLQNNNEQTRKSLAEERTRGKKRAQEIRTSNCIAKTKTRGK
jgi:hypothetical protein